MKKLFIIGIIILVGLVSVPIIWNSTDELTTAGLVTISDILPGRGTGVVFSSDNNYMFVSHITTPFVTIYEREDDTFTKLANLSDLPAGNGYDIDITDDDNYLAIGVYGTSPYLAIYKRSGDTFTKLADPNDIPVAGAFAVQFSHSGIYLAVGVESNTYGVIIYKRSGDTFTKLADPTLINTYFQDITFSSDDTYMAVAAADLKIYKRSGDIFTSISDNIDTQPPGGCYGVAFTSDNNYLAVSASSSPFVNIYLRTNDTFTKLADPDVLPSGALSNEITFSNSDDYLVAVLSDTPFMIIYHHNAGSLTKLPNPSVLPGGWGYNVAFSPDDTYLAVTHDGVGTPKLIVYKQVNGSFVTADPGILYNTTTGTLVDLLPTLFVIGIVVGVAGYLIFKKKQE